MMSSDAVDGDQYLFASSVAAAGRRDEDFGPLLKSGDWLNLEPDPNQWVWTDDYSNIIGAVIRHLRN
jgi:hypothetical protein